MLRFALTLYLFLGLLSCGSRNESRNGDFPTGIWRATLSIQGQEVPFNLDVQKDLAGSFNVFILNGQERLLLDEVSANGDSVIIPLHIFDASIRARFADNSLDGYFTKHYEKNYKVPFHATAGLDYRFKASQSSYPDVNFSGKYAVTFYEEDDTVQAVGVFTQNGKNLTGSFLTPTGDYRYLEGDVFGDSLRMSTFDGNYIYLFKAKGDAEHLQGRFYSGKTKNIKWEATRNENATTQDAESITYLKEGYDKIDFAFPDVNGNKVTLSDEKYRNKVVVLQIFGTWCPNCMDETRFLSPWYDKNKERGVEIIGLAYERKDDFTYASERLKKMIAKLNVHYDFVIAGVNDKEKASKTLPMLNEIAAFPTTIFIGKNGKVRKIHSGFSGPGTGIYYDQFIEDFNETINALLAESPNGSSTAKL